MFLLCFAVFCQILLWYSIRMADRPGTAHYILTCQYDSCAVSPFWRSMKGWQHLWPGISLWLCDLGTSLRLSVVPRLLAFQRPLVYLRSTCVWRGLQQLRNRRDAFTKRRGEKDGDDRVRRLAMKGERISFQVSRCFKMFQDMSISRGFKYFQIFSTSKEPDCEQSELCAAQY